MNPGSKNEMVEPAFRVGVIKLRLRQVEVMAKLSEKYADVKNFADGLNGVQKDYANNSAAAAQKTLDIEIEKINLLRAQYQISEADAAKRIAALKNQALLQKNLSERKDLQSEIKVRQSELAHVTGLAAKSPGLVEATNRKNDAESNVADLKKQLEDIPKAIKENNKAIAAATGNAKSAKYVPDKAAWYQKADSLKDQNGRLQTQFDSAQAQYPGAVKQAANADQDVENANTYKSRIGELHQIIPGLQNKLGGVVDKQRKLTPLEIEQNNLDAQESQAKAIKPGAYKPEKTSIEKMGFVMGGPSGDSSKIIADNTRQTNAILLRIAGLLNHGGGGGGGETNQI